MPSHAARQYELDWLRLLAVVTVVGLHLAQTYVHASGGPKADAATQSAVLDLLFALTASFRMPLLFCLAGMVAVLTRGHRSVGEYLRNRVQRLVAPLLIGLAVLTPAQRALEHQLTGESGGLLAWGFFWFLGALAVITIVTLPAGVWLARPPMQARLARMAPHGRTLVLLAGLPLVGTLLPYRLVGDAPVLGQVGLKTLVVYGGYFLAGMILASAPGFRPTVIRRRGTALVVGAIAAAVQVLGPRLGIEAHVLVVAGAVTSWAWVLACYGYAARHLAAPSPTLARWAPRALAVYVLHGVALAAAQCVALPIDMPVALQVTLLAVLTTGGTLVLVRLAEGFRDTSTVLGLRYAPVAGAPRRLLPAAWTAWVVASPPRPRRIALDQRV